METRAPIAANISRFPLLESIWLLAVRPNGKDRLRKPREWRKEMITLDLYFRANS